jgi:hypothetical protein
LKNNVIPDSSMIYLISTVFFFLSLSAACLAKEYYVDAVAETGGDGLMKAPFVTIQKAADVMGPGDICLIAPGVYPESVRPAVAERYLYVYRSDGEMPKEPYYVKRRMIAFDHSGRSHIRLEDLEINASTLDTDRSSSYLVMDELKILHPYHSSESSITLSTIAISTTQIISVQWPATLHCEEREISSVIAHSPG